MEQTGIGLYPFRFAPGTACHRYRICRSLRSDALT